jgi:diguanylate cyclase (GGDEF)-like protein
LTQNNVLFGVCEIWYSFDMEHTGENDTLDEARRVFNAEDSRANMEDREAYITHLEEAIRARDMEIERLRDLAFRDDLTGLYKRGALADAVQNYYAVKAREGVPPRYGLIAFDLDGFKAINDKMGHFVGDETLRRVAVAVSEGLRPSDVFARMGGDEFVLMLPDTDSAGTEIVAERVRKAIARVGSEMRSEDPRFPGVAGSVGAASLEDAQGFYPEMTHDQFAEFVDDLSHDAKAMKENKERGAAAGDSTGNKFTFTSLMDKGK